MIVPRYWAEAKLQNRTARRSVTVRKFGWSDVSTDAAQQHANQRAKEALAAILSGEPLPRRDRKVRYNGSEGVPIREEIVASHGDVRITRNSYGALCLNTPDVLFVDLDFAMRPPGLLVALSALGIFSLFASMTAGMKPALRIIGSLIAAAVFAGQIAAVRWRIQHLLHGNEEEQALQRISNFVDQHPDWHFRVYRTPAGLRALAMHRTFDPHEDDVAKCFEELKADPVYSRMCQRQNCFRARVSPKPWRIGVREHIRPRNGAWPVRDEVKPAREAWIKNYEALAAEFASCRFIGDFGSLKMDAKASMVRDLHDRLCQAESELPLA